MDKNLARHMLSKEDPNLPVNMAFDIASLILYGTNALPIRLKMLLDRLFQGLPQSDLVHVVTGFGWTLDDYTRGYQLQVMSP